MKLNLPKKDPIQVLRDTARLLCDLAAQSPNKRYLVDYAKDLQDATKEIDSELHRGELSRKLEFARSEERRQMGGS